MRSCRSLITKAIQNVIISAAIVQNQLFAKNILQQAAELINEAEKPFVIFGQGVILGKAEKEFKNLLKNPVFLLHGPSLGLSALPTDHPLNVGMLGMHGNYGPNVLNQ